MVNEPKRTELSNAEDFAKLAEQTGPGFFHEMWIFVRYYKKWWLMPVILLLLLLGAFIILGSGAAAPFIYTLF